LPTRCFTKLSNISCMSPTSNQQQTRQFQQALLAWFQQHRREMPWRENRDPYRVWVSEIMLQQTQVETVRGYFDRFLTAFPTVNALAEADEQEVLRLWEGLGYYRRARQLHASARQVIDKHDGEFPRSVDQLLALPGIGRYTAGAIASIAFDLPAPILEANTQRLFARLLAWQRPTAESASQKRLWQFAEAILPTHDVGIFNQALMELGSLVCKPKQPQCLTCPVHRWCVARRQNLVAAVPVASPKKKFIDVTEYAVVVRKRNHVLVRQCGADERWAGLWDFPRFFPDDQAKPLDPSQLAEHLRAAANIDAILEEQLATIKHGVTKYRIALHAYAMSYCKGRLRGQKGPDGAPRKWKWITTTQLKELPLSTTGRKLAKLATSQGTV